MLLFIDAYFVLGCAWYFQKQPLICVLRKRCSKNIQQVYMRTPMSKCDFNNVALQRYWNGAAAWVFSCKFSEHLFIRTPLGGCFCCFHWLVLCVLLLSEKYFYLIYILYFLTYLLRCLRVSWIRLLIKTKFKESTINTIINHSLRK